LKSEVAMRRPIDVEMMMEKQRLKRGENIFILYQLLAVDETTDEGDERRRRCYIDLRRRTRRVVKGMNGGSGGSERRGMEFAASARN
jgi:hypothetical protein